MKKRWNWLPCRRHFNKITQSMKITMVLLLAGALHLSAEVKAQTGVSLEMKNVSVQEVLNRLEQLTDYTFLYKMDLLEDCGKVDVSAKNEEFGEMLKRFLEPLNLTYTVDDRVVILLPRAEQQVQQEMRTITGKVTDEGDVPLPGVTVLIKGTTMGTATDADGNYQLAVPDGEVTLVFTMVGMESREVAVGERTEINVTMVADVAEMDEVVVTGIFQKARESYTGSVSTVNKEELRMFKGQNMLQTLRNIDASLNIAMNNAFGSDPNQLPQINIRGTSSLPMSIDELNENTRQSVNAPLIIMDGFEISLTKLMDYNDDVIESITILKDASATAIYGSRGANGVIVITTLKPEPGKLRVTLQAGITAELPDLDSYDLLNAAEKLDLENRIGLYEIEGNPGRTAEYQKQYNKRLKDVLSGVDTDWLALPLRNGIGQQYNLRLEGGSEEFRWSTTLGYKDTQGAMKGSSRKVFNGDIMLSYTHKNLLFQNSTSISNTVADNSPYGSYSQYVEQQPYNRIYDDEGNLIRYFDGFYADSDPVQNPLYDAMLNIINKSKTLSLINNFAVEWKIINGLTLRGQLGISTNRTTSDLFYPAEHSMFSDESVYPVGSTRKGSYTYGTGEDFSYDGRVTLSYSNLFKDVHQVYVGLDYSISATNTKNYSFVAEGFANEDLSFIGNALQYAEGGAPIATQDVSRRIGFTGNVNYTYDNRYYVDASFRTDGSSQFGAKKRFAPFWSVGIGWNLHREKFMESVSFINSLRLKASIGETGAMDFSKSDVLTMYTYPSGERYALWNRAELQGLGNESLTWQKTDETNVGIEFQLFNGRFFGSFDYYIKKTDGLVSSMNLPLSMGFSSYSENVGEVKNTGYELSLGGYLIRNTERNFSWSVNGQLVYNKNEVVKLSDAILAQNEEYIKEQGEEQSQGVLAGEGLSDTEPANLLYEGRPQYGLYVVRSLGIDPATGEEIFLDKNGNVTNEWNTEDRVYCGQDATYSSPYRGNLSTLVRWKDLSFSMSFGFQWGGQMYNSTLRDRVEVTTANIQARNVDRRVYTERWQNVDDAVFFKRIETIGTEDYKTNATSRFVMDDNWFEIQTIGLEYRWATEGLKKAIGAQSILFGVNMSNLWHFSSVKYERGTDYPFARNLQATVSIMF